MDIRLSLYEQRVIGCLIEKQHTTPEQYPLSLNALTNACNQKSSREPVLNLDEATVQDVVDGLVKRRYVSTKSGFGSRVTKYQHRFCNTEFGSLQLSDQELGILCVLMLRGPQTPGELRTRTERLCKFADIHEVESTLEHLGQRDDGPFVMQLPREPGRREARFAHLFGEQMESPAAVAAEAAFPAEREDADRIEQLAQIVAELRVEVESLKSRIGQLEKQNVRE
ncbi:MAG: DUF480 domain-containing protein [Thiogranum sp.]|nr:DUF480 domain-containing protein [Thiogranum sp.]